MRYLLGLVLLLWLLTGCARPPEPSWVQLPTASELLAQITANQNRFFSLDAAAAVGLTVKGKYFSSQQFLLLEKPDRLRTDVLTGFGQLALQLASNGEELSVFLNTTVPGRFFHGLATAENLARFTRVPLAARDMVRLLLYDPPLIEYRQTQVKQVENTLLLRLTNAELQQEIIFDEQLRLISCRYLSKGNPTLEVFYEKLSKDSQFPQIVRIELVAEETKVTLKFSELQTNVSIKPERFQLKKPEKIPIEALP